jgi:hypothetical protein
MNDFPGITLKGDATIKAGPGTSITSRLDPPDTERCQAEMANGDRCTSKPTVLLTLKEAEEDGQIGSMTLCAECLEVFHDQEDTPDAFIRRIES